MTEKISNDDLVKLGTFEISKYLLKLAKENAPLVPVLNAGQGDPNWINTKARLAFNRLVEFGVIESRRTIDDPDLAGYLVPQGIGARLREFLSNKGNEEDLFLIDSLDYVHNQLEIEEDSLVAEWLNGVIGNSYPTPSRSLTHAEQILNQYLASILYKDQSLSKETELFLTEGGTAAIVYIFQSFRENHLIALGDKIAINTPIFPPYLEIPILNDYEMVEVDFESNEKNNWQLDPKELDKLMDPSIKALFIANPSNPGSKALSKDRLDKLKEIVTKRPDLLIITDDVYGTFVEGFESIYSALPYNTLLVYSFSKLFGAAGWRLGLIAANKNNLFDKKIHSLPTEQQNQLNTRYKSDSAHPESMKFIDRIVADSRSIGLYHTSGLSTPQQMMEVLFALSHLIEVGKDDAYIDLTKKIIADRYNNLHDSLSMKKDSSSLNSKYYSLINMYEVGEALHGSDFGAYMRKTYRSIDMLVDLAKEKGIVLAYGPGFGTEEGYVRVSEANLPTEDYTVIGNKIIELLNEYYTHYQTI